MSVLINGTILLRTSPATIAERGQPGEMQDRDKIVSGLGAVAQYLALTVIRTVFEDRLLHAERAGYREYAQDVRFRLVPGIW